MTPTPLRIRPADTPHALAIYAGQMTLGWMFLSTGLSTYVTDTVGQAWDDVLMLGMMFSGLVALVAALYSGKVHDPTRGFIVELLSLIPLIVVTAVVIIAALSVYGFSSAPTLTILLSFINMGHIGRMGMIIWELWKLRRARREAITLVTAVLADPKG